VIKLHAHLVAVRGKPGAVRGAAREEFAARIKLDVPRWAKIVRDANITVD